jgi:hypothetical protein
MSRHVGGVRAIDQMSGRHIEGRGVPFNSIEVPAGEALIGAASHPAILAESPATLVALRAFLIAWNPVTNAQYAVFVRVTGHRPPSLGTTPSLTSTGTTPRPSANGPASGCRQKRNGRRLLAERMVGGTPGARIGPPRARRTATGGSEGQLRSARFRPAAVPMGSSTSAATSGSGPRASIVPTRIEPTTGARTGLVPVAGFSAEVRSVTFPPPSAAPSAARFIPTRATNTSGFASRSTPPASTPSYRSTGWSCRVAPSEWEPMTRGARPQRPRTGKRTSRRRGWAALVMLSRSPHS